MEYRDLKEAYYDDKQIYWHDNMVDYINWLEDKIIDSQTNWISVEDRLPELDETVLLFDDWQTIEGEKYKDVRVGYLSSFTTMNTSKGISHICEWGGTEFAFNITYWQPLPTPPKH